MESGKAKMAKTKKLLGGNRVLLPVFCTALVTLLLALAGWLWTLEIAAGRVAAGGVIVGLMLLFVTILLYNSRGDDIDNLKGFLESKFKSIDLRFQSIDLRFQSIDLRFQSIDNTLKELTNQMARLDTRGSPRALTGRGKKISKAINAKGIANKYLSKVESRVKKGDSAYTIQELCLEFASNELSELLSDDENATLQDVAYEEGVSVEAITHRVIGIELRDIVLANCAKSVSGVGGKV